MNDCVFLLLIKRNKYVSVRAFFYRLCSRNAKDKLKASVCTVRAQCFLVQNISMGHGIKINSFSKQLPEKTRH